MKSFEQQMSDKLINCHEQLKMLQIERGRWCDLRAIRERVEDDYRTIPQPDHGVMLDDLKSLLAEINSLVGKYGAELIHRKASQAALQTFVDAETNDNYGYATKADAINRAVLIARAVLANE